MADVTYVKKLMTVKCAHCGHKEVKQVLNKGRGG